jgi:sodium transport system permease protein
VGLYLGVRGATEIPPEINEVLFDILTPSVVGMIISLLVPLAVFFAAMILAVSIHAKSFKEAQSSLTPLSFFVFIPIALGFLPGVELNVVTSLIPILNVSLATKDVIAGTIDPVNLGLTYVSLFALATASLAFCVAWFKREDTLFRT